MGPTLTLKREVDPPDLPVARLHGRGAAIERAQRSMIAAVVLILFWLLPVAALALTFFLVS